MNFTDVFIKKPVMALVVTFLIILLGYKSFTSLPFSEYPKTQNSTITITTAYYGADPQTIAGFITQPLEGAIAQVQGIDFLSSTSVNGLSTIIATLKLNYDANAALANITTKITSVKNQLPPQAQASIMDIKTGQSLAAMYMGFNSENFESNSLTDYLLRVVKPKLDAVEGVQNAEILGGRKFAIRAWLDQNKMAGLNVSASDVYKALASNNYLSAVGTTKGDMVSIDLKANTDLQKLEDFNSLVIKANGSDIVRLNQIATVTLGSEDYSINVQFSGKQSIFIGINAAPNANVLDVAKNVREVFPGLVKDLPQGVKGQIVYDSTKSITASIKQVEHTIIEALVIVTVVIFLFMGSFRAIVIPIVAMPLSLIGTFIVMSALGYSLNLLTLLAFVLAIGLVVDDAIIVVENVDRHLKEGKSPMEASLLSARELGVPIFAMTIVLVVVFIPIGFQKGITGALFSEFVFTLAGSVVISGIVALTLSPMMCSRLLKHDHNPSKFLRTIDGLFLKLENGFRVRLRSLLTTWQVLVIMGALILLSLGYLFSTAKTELAPTEDRGLIYLSMTGPPNATVNQMQTYANQLFEISSKEEEFMQMFQLTFANSGFGGVLLKDWDERSKDSLTVQKELQQKFASIAGIRAQAFHMPALPGATGAPLQMIIKTTEPYENLNEVTQKVVEKLYKSGLFFFVDSDLKINKPQDILEVDKDKIAALGMTQQDVANELSIAMSGGYVNYFAAAGRSYRVIPQVLQVNRLNTDQILNQTIRTPKGDLIQVRSIAKIVHKVIPTSINHFQQLNSAQLVGAFLPTVSEGEIIDFVTKTIYEVAPTGYSVDYSGPTRQSVQESGGFVGIMLFSIAIVFLVLAAQYNSFRDPIVVLVSVPMAIFGALIFINLGWTSINIYTKVGLVTLVGLISKHGILIVDFANHLQAEGRSKLEAIIEATSIRLRPILMTTAAMVFGVIPLVLASGAGAAGTSSMGKVIFTGLSLGTFFTLFVVPAMYYFLAADHHTETKDDVNGGMSDASKVVTSH